MSIPRECKRLIEVDFPIAAVSRQSAREKSIRHGHPSTLHLWWARRPLAACRAVLLSLLLPDPCDPLCPDEFREKARNLVTGFAHPPKTDMELRNAIIRFIAAFSDWDNSSNQVYVNTARELVRAAQDGAPPLVVDPFSGGGSIPLEALRIGCEAFASELNPVACLILKVMLEDIPSHRREVAKELRSAGIQIKAAVEKEMEKYYPLDPDGAKPIAYIWARTVHCETPNCGAEIPLVRSFWLCKKPKRRRALRFGVHRVAEGVPVVDFEIFEPKTGSQVPVGTVSRANATCLCCGTVLPAERVRAQLAVQHGGADALFNAAERRTGGARLLAVVTLRPAGEGRSYRLPSEHDYRAVRDCMEELRQAGEEPPSEEANSIPDEPLPPTGTLGFRVQRYGMATWGDLFTARQRLGLVKFVRAINRIEATEVVRELLAFCLSHTVDRSSSLCQWSPEPYMETVLHVYNLNALPMVWDFAEAVLTSESTGSFMHALEVKVACTESLSAGFDRPGQVQMADAAESPLPDSSAAVWFTDPPYYDAVPYADLSDFFYVWLKRALPNNTMLRDIFDSKNPLTPKQREIVQDETKEFGGAPKDGTFFEARMALSFGEGRRVMRDDGIACIVFAHKTTEGWEALLSGMLKGGWVVTASWPIATERPNRLRAFESAVLSASVHLICRPRSQVAPVGDWGEVLRQLSMQVNQWMERLESEGVRGADLVFACIGPALEIFSRYSKVETAEGREVYLGECLSKIWEVVGRAALGQILGTEDAKADSGVVGALEEDARLTALFLWTLQSTGIGRDAATDVLESGSATEDGQGRGEETGSTRKEGGYRLAYDIVRRFAQPLGIHLGAWEGRIVEMEKGVVRLLPVSERAPQIFGGKGTEALATEPRPPRGPVQTSLLPNSESRKGMTSDGQRLTKSTKIPTPLEMTTLDRVHGAMLLQTAGQSGALREFLEDEFRRGPQFLRLANALSALYPKKSEEKRLLDAVLVAVQRR